MLNTENINRLIERIREDKGVHMKMGDFAAYLDDEARHADRYEPCNTAFCLCGHANMILLQDKGVDPLSLKEEFFDRIGDDGTAADFIGLPDDAINSLFFMSPSRFGMKRFDHLPQQTRADAAIRVLEILRDTGEVDWDTAIEEASAQTSSEEGQRPDTGLPLVDRPA